MDFSIKAYFKDRGGVLENKDYIGTFKAASKKLRDRGMSNRNYGMWVINYKEQTVEVLPSQKEVVNYCADKEIGFGKNAVYVYYYDIYRKFAELNNQIVWECKIGRTDGDPLQRVFSQAGTSYPELPHLALIIRCQTSARLETALHEILRFRNRWIKDAPGDEWFMTSPDEVEEIYFKLLEVEEDIQKNN